MRQRSNILMRTAIYTQQPSTSMLGYEFDIEESRQQIRDSFSQLSKVINQIQELIERRVAVHQKHLIEVMKSEINRMQGDIKSIVQKYNFMIQHKNKDEELFEVKNQLEYYKSEVRELHIHNEFLRKEIERVKKLNKDRLIDIQTNKHNIERLTKKVLKHRTRQKLLTRSVQEKEDTANLQSTDKTYGQFTSNRKLKTPTHSQWKKRSVNRTHSIMDYKGYNLYLPTQLK